MNNKWKDYMDNGINDRQKQLFLNIAFFGVFACAALIFLLLAFDKIPPVSNHKDKSKETETISTEAESETGTESDLPKETLAAETSITISLMGDCTLASSPSSDPYNNFDAFKTVKGIDYFFQNVKSYLEEDDLSIINFEGTFTTTDSAADKSDTYKGDPSYVTALTDSSIEAANLANDHTRDYGSIGFADTQTTLQNAGITTFGADETALLEVKGIQIGLIGVSAVDQQLSDCRSQATSLITSIKEQGADLVIVNFHWGNDNESTPTTDQTALAHAAIDAGADLIVGHNPHVLQGMEVYNGRTIFYSLGSFCDGSKIYPNDLDTVIFQPTLTFNTNKELTSTTNSIIPCRISSDSSYNNYQPTPLDGSEKTRIEQKIKDLSSQIGNSISSSGSSITPESEDETSSNTPSSDSESETTDTTNSGDNSSGNSSSENDSSDNSSVKLFLPD